MNNKLIENSKNISEELLKDLYINKNKSKKEICEILNLTDWSLSKLLKYYDLHKSRVDILEKRKQTNILKYGVDNPSKSDYVKSKIIESNIKKYGANSFTATEEGKKKIAATKLNRYSDKNYNNTDQSRLTKAIRYGDENYNNRSKYKKTMLDNYNVDNSFKLKKTKENYLDKLFVKKEYSDIFKPLINDRDKSIKYLEGNNYNYSYLANQFNCPYYIIQNWVTRLDLKDYIDYSFKAESSYEADIIKTLLDIGVTYIERHNRDILDGQEIDIYIPDKKIGIEFNGDYWHSDLFKSKNYHFEKSKLAQERGIRLINIYQHEWDDSDSRQKIISLLKIACGKVDSKIYARNCEIKLISNREAKTFNDKNHIQGHRNAHITLGLFYENRLVQLMSFSHNKKYEWEIIRGCPGSNNIVIGGVSKLFKYFVDNYNPTQIFSYCDFNKFDGKSYENLGMKFIGYTGPDMKYSIKGKVINRQPHKYNEIKDLIDFRILGSGSKKYLWTKE